MNNETSSPTTDRLPWDAYDHGSLQRMDDDGYREPDLELAAQERAARHLEAARRAAA